MGSGRPHRISLKMTSGSRADYFGNPTPPPPSICRGLSDLTKEPLSGFCPHRLFHRWSLPIFVTKASHSSHALHWGGGGAGGALTRQHLLQTPTKDLISPSTTNAGFVSNDTKEIKEQPQADTPPDILCTHPRATAAHHIWPNSGPSFSTQTATPPQCLGHGT